MNAAIIAGLLFRQTLERLPIDMRALGEMLGCVDDVIAALREYHQEAQWIERQRQHEGDRLAQAASDAPLSPLQAPGPA